MKNYKIIGNNNPTFKAPDDKVAALVVARIGDFGFKDQSGNELFPACWDENEFAQYLGKPLPEALKEHTNDVIEAIRTIKW